MCIESETPSPPPDRQAQRLPSWQLLADTHNTILRGVWPSGLGPITSRKRLRQLSLPATPTAIQEPRNQNAQCSNPPHPPPQITHRARYRRAAHTRSARAALFGAHACLARIPCAARLSARRYGCGALHDAVRARRPLAARPPQSSRARSRLKTRPLAVRSRSSLTREAVSGLDLAHLGGHLRRLRRAATTCGVRAVQLQDPRV